MSWLRKDTLKKIYIYDLQSLYVYSYKQDYDWLKDIWIEESGYSHSPQV